MEWESVCVCVCVCAYVLWTSFELFRYIITSPQEYVSRFLEKKPFSLGLQPIAELYSSTAGMSSLTSVRIWWREPQAHCKTPSQNQVCRVDIR